MLVVAVVLLVLVVAVIIKWKRKYYRNRMNMLNRELPRVPEEEPAPMLHNPDDPMHHYDNNDERIPQGADGGGGGHGYDELMRNCLNPSAPNVGHNRERVTDEDNLYEGLIGHEQIPPPDVLDAAGHERPPPDVLLLANLGRAPLVQPYEQITGYEQVPPTDISQLRVAISNRAGHRRYERNQPYERITGYEQVPAVNVAQLCIEHNRPHQ